MSIAIGAVLFSVHVLKKTNMPLSFFFLFCSCTPELALQETPIQESPPDLPSPEEIESLRKKKEARKLQDIAQDVACLRGHDFSPVPFLEHQNKEDFAAFIRDDVEKEYRSEKGKNFEKTLKGLRLIPNDYDLEKSFIDMLHDQAAAYYNPETKGFYIVQKMSGMLLGVTIAHELQHALQDQHTNILKNYSADHFRSFDQEMAARFLVEGEATLFGNAWLMHDMSSFFGVKADDSCLSEEPTQKLQIFWFSLNDFIQETAFVSRSNTLNIPKWMELLLNMAMPFSAAQEGLKNLPNFHYHTLNAPYLRGSWYAYSKFKQGHWKRSALDNLFVNPPQTTEQVLHPHKDHPVPKEPSVARIPSSITKAWAPQEPNSMGELGLIIWFIEHGMKEEDAFRTAEGWNGDRVQLWTKELDSAQKYAISWVLVFDTPEQAKTIRTAFHESISKTFLGFTASSWNPEENKGKEDFSYAEGKGKIEWTANQITLWWGF